MVKGQSSLKGAVGDDDFTSDGVSVLPTVGHGQEAGGGRSGACGMLAKEEERGKRKGWAAFVMPLIGVAGGRGRRGGVRGSVHVKERDKRREVGLARRSVAGTGPWPTGTGRRRTRAWHGAE
jgi:hypothetical protein